MSKEKVAIIGATGLVGQTFLKILEEQDEEYDLKLFASKKSVGKKIKYKNKYYIVNLLNEHSFEDIEYACFFTNSDIAKHYIPIAIKNNVKVIDNSACFRMEDNIKLIAYGVNDYLIDKNDYLLTNPNCCVIQSVKVIKLLKEYGIKSIIYNTYQSVSGSGKKGIDDLLRCRNGDIPLFYETDISFTCIPKIGTIKENDFTDEEIKMIQESKKILNDSKINVYATCVRVPVMFSHGVSIQVEIKKDINIDEFIEKIKQEEGLVYCDNISPTSVLSCKSDNVYVGRVRKLNNNILFYCTADNIRVGAATNSYLILKKLIKTGGKNG